jgi:hypothetical protein
MKVREFEDKCWRTDNIRVVIRAPADASVASSFNWVNGAIGTNTVSWYRDRIAPKIGSYEFVIIDGRGAEPHGGNHLNSVRGTYS